MSAGTCSANPRITPSGSLSASQREIWTTAGASSGSGCSSNSSAVRSTRPGVPSWRTNRAGRRSPSGATRPAASQHGAHRLAVEFLVLRGEHVDRGRDHDDLVAVQPLPRERFAREHVGVGLGDVGLEERPGLAGELVRVVEPDVAAPDHRGALRLERVEHARRLRVVQDHHVALVHARRDLRDIARQHALVRAPGVVVERQAVALGAVQPVVDPLGDREELGRAVDHHPARVDAGAARVGDERAEQLDDPAAAGGRVDVPDDPAAEQHAGHLHPALELLIAAGWEDGAEPLRAHR